MLFNQSALKCSSFINKLSTVFFVFFPFLSTETKAKKNKVCWQSTGGAKMTNYLHTFSRVALVAFFILLNDNVHVLWPIKTETRLMVCSLRDETLCNCSTQNLPDSIQKCKIRFETKPTSREREHVWCLETSIPTVRIMFLFSKTQEKQF